MLQGRLHLWYFHFDPLLTGGHLLVFFIAPVHFLHVLIQLQNIILLLIRLDDVVLNCVKIDPAVFPLLILFAKGALQVV